MTWATSARVMVALGLKRPSERPFIYGSWPPVLSLARAALGAGAEASSSTAVSSWGSSALSSSITSSSSMEGSSGSLSLCSPESLPSSCCKRASAPCESAPSSATAHTGRTAISTAMNRAVSSFIHRIRILKIYLQKKLPGGARPPSGLIITERLQNCNLF